MKFEAPTVEELTALFPRYTIRKLVAKGGMGAVYLALQEDLERDVAIKIMPKELGNDEGFRDAFRLEAKVMAKLTHPNLVTLFEFGDADGMPYLVMEFVHGQSLFHLANGKAIDQVEAARLMVMVCDGIQHAHDKGVIHRDLKPANILVSDDGVPKVTDFGLAGPMNERGEGVLMGTPGYTAPEVFSREGAVDQRADVYSLAVILYELLTGRVPEDGFLMPSQVTDADPAFDAILRKALHPTALLRMASAAEMKHSLEEALQGLNQSGASEQRLKAKTPLSAKKSIESAAKPRLLKAGERANSPSLGAAPLASKKTGLTGPVLVSILALLLIVGFAFLFLSKGTNDSEEALSSSAPDLGETLTDGEKRAPQVEKVSAREIKNQLYAQKTSISFGKRDRLPPQAIKLGNRHFLMLEEEMTWFDALEFCEKFGAQLACLHSEADLSRLREAGLWSDGPDLFWCGAYAPEAGEPFVWSDGESISIDQGLVGYASSDWDRFLACNLRAGRFLPKEPNEALPILMEWTEADRASGAFEFQLKRLVEALKDGSKPIWPAGTVEVDGVHFLVVPNRVSWQAARVQAEGHGGRLARVLRKKELDAVQPALALRFKGRGSVWIAGRFILGKGWRWASGEEMDFSPWLPSEPVESREVKRAVKIGKQQGASDFGFMTEAMSEPADGYLIEWRNSE